MPSNLLDCKPLFLCSVLWSVFSLTLKIVLFANRFNEYLNESSDLK